MTQVPLDLLPAERREAAQAALHAAFGAKTSIRLEQLRGGASGALLYRVAAKEKSYVLRVEGARSPLRNPHQYACMRTAAEADVAPALRHADPEAGIAIMDCVQSEPLAKFPGGPKQLAAAVGQLAARLQNTPSFPAFHDYAALLTRMIEGLSHPDFFVAGLLAPHRELFERIREAYPWRGSALVSSHNDPNPQNLLFDGRRLWLVDWETAYLNEPLTDVAILAESFAATSELESALLEGWCGTPPDAELRARLQLMRLLSRLYYAGLLLSIGRARAARSTPDSDLRAPTRAEFGAAVAKGGLSPGSGEVLYTLGKMMLASFLKGAEAPALDDALATVRVSRT